MTPEQIESESAKAADENDSLAKAPASSQHVMGETDDSSGPTSSVQRELPSKPPLNITTMQESDEGESEDPDLISSAADELKALQISADGTEEQQLLMQTSLTQQQSLISSHGSCSESINPHATSNVFNFAAEHKIFLQAILDLLAERDQRAPKVGMNDPNVLKSGPLKKASHLMNGVWKVKYVEIRRGMFSYYENDTKSELLRKNIPLEASCRCRPVKLHQKALKMTLDGAIFEVSINGNKRLWMANSRKERQAWMQAIHSARVGGSLTRSDSVLNLADSKPKASPKHEMRNYRRAQNALRTSKSRSEFLATLGELQEQILVVPVKWVAKQQQDMDENSPGAFREESVNLGVAQLWRDLQRDSILINGELFVGGTGHEPEKMMGALTRQLLGISKNLRESQAVEYARDVLLSGNRTRTGGDSYFCVSNLVRSDLVIIVPSTREAEPVTIAVATSPNISTQVAEKSGWIKTKSKLQRSFRKLFFVMSEGTLSYYERAIPRPHRLRGQLVMTGATLAISRKPLPSAKTETTASASKNASHFVMHVTSKEGSSRVLFFETEDRLLDWTFALESAARAATSASGVSSDKRGHRRKTSNEVPGSASNRKQEVSETMSAEEATKEHFANLGIDKDFVEARLAVLAKKASHVTLVSIQASTEYNVITTDPQGDEAVDTWATLRAEFLQSFRVTGGPNSRIIRGEEIVQICVTDCIEDEAQTSTPRRSRKGRIFRSFAGNDDENEAVLAGIEM